MRRCLLLCLLLLARRPAEAQSNMASAEIRGKISDPSGAVIPGAQVSINNKQTSLSRTVDSNDRGEYVLLSVAPGLYDIRVEVPGFPPQVSDAVQITVGQTMVLDFTLKLGQALEVVNVTTAVPPLETKRMQQSNTVDEAYVRNLPIDRRDYLTFTLLMPGIVDSSALADNTDFRVVQTRDSGLSFYGSSGRGNSITVDGAEANNAVGGVRPTLSQEAVQEFEINRSNYSAELGGASGGVINIISKSGSNEWHGSLLGFFRHEALDASDPFAIALVGDSAQRVKPQSRRQQYGATLGFPIRKDRTFLFSSFERLNRDESSAVSVLTNTSIFRPTAIQNDIINRLAADPSSTPITCLGPLAGGLTLVPGACANGLRDVLTSKSSTVELFRTNSGVLPFTGDSNAFSVRIDHTASSAAQLFLRYNYTKLKEGNQSTRALVGFSRSNRQETLDGTAVAGLIYTFNPKLINETRVQLNYRDNYIRPNDTYGPEISIPGFGFFGRDFGLPSYWWERRYEASNSLTFATGTHRIKTGANLLLRATKTDSLVFFGGRLNFGALPGALVSPLLDGTNITALQAFDLGIPGSFQIGAGNPRVGSTDPSYAVYLQDTWDAHRALTLNYGLRYEYDHRRHPVPTDKNNFAPRVGFSWRPLNNKTMVVRGGYGIFYAPIYYQIDWVVNALNEIDGYRPIAQVLTTLNAANPLAVNGPINIYRTLRSQGVIGIPSSSRGISAADLAQFGIGFVHSGDRPPLTVLFRHDPNYRNSYSQQASLGVEHEFRPGTNLGINYISASTLNIPRSRDLNVLPRPVGPRGIREWTATSGCTGAALAQCFRNPLLFQENVYESTGRAIYHGITVEMRQQVGRNFRLDGNYTFSKAIDEVTDFNSDFQANDQTNLRAERALSAFDQRHKVVVYGYIRSPFEPASTSFPEKILTGFVLTPIFRANSARPFNLLTGADVNGDRHSTTDRPPFAGRNTGIGPDFWTLDVRLTRELTLGETRKLEIMFEGFNIFNRLNFASVNNTVGPDFAPPFRVKAREDRGPSEPLGFTSAYDPRRIQLGVRLTF